MSPHSLKLHLLILLILGLYASVDSSNANNSETAQKIQTPLNCGFDERLDKLFQSNPKAIETQEKLELDYQQFIDVKSSEKNVLTNYVLPVVVHIIHQNGSENISDAQVTTAIQQLNESFANTGYYDQGEGAVVPIQFCLATQAPSGSGTTGITRDVSPLTTLVYQNDDLNLKGINRWDPNCYINIWVVEEIISASSGAGVAGYAYLPTAHGQPEDGIVVEANFFGSSPSNNVVLIHEMGHYLGLYHTFQGGCTNNDCMNDGDRVCDTPPDQSTSPVTCSSSVNTCSTDTDSGFTTDQPDMFSNYMDYGDLPCYNRFTQGQSDRMEFFVTGARSSLLACASCADPCPITINPNIVTSTETVIVGNSLTAYSNSPGASNRTWEIEGNIFSGSSVNYTYVNEGIVTIYLMVSNALYPDCIFTDSLQIEVLCNVDAQFESSNNECLQLNESVSFTNTSLNTNGIEWHLNNTLVSTGDLFATSFSSPGVYVLQLYANNNYCSDWTEVYKIYVGCTEVCDNGYDDDQDGLVDCFDPDCFCDSICENYYFDPCITSTCELEDPLEDFEAEEMWRTNYPTYTLSSVAPFQVGWETGIIYHQSSLFRSGWFTIGIRG